MGNIPVKSVVYSKFNCDREHSETTSIQDVFYFFDCVIHTTQIKILGPRNLRILFKFREHFNGEGEDSMVPNP